MRMGNFVASVGHLKTLMETVFKDKHGIKEKDVSLKDKMKIAAVMRFCDPKV